MIFKEPLLPLAEGHQKTPSCGETVKSTRRHITKANKPEVHAFVRVDARDHGEDAWALGASFAQPTKAKNDCPLVLRNDLKYAIKSQRKSSGLSSKEKNCCMKPNFGPVIFTRLWPGYGTHFYNQAKRKWYGDQDEKY